MDTSTLPATDFLRLTGPFGAVCDRLPAAAWDQPSPCEGWTARDVLRHVIDTEREFLTLQGVELPEPPPDAEPAAAWHAHTDALAAALADPAVAEREYDGHFGPTTVGDTLLRFYGFDLVVHRWDLATSAGLEERLTEEELDFVESSAAGFGEALYSEGVCRRGPEVPADADRQARLLALLGRRG
ncbi:TIGR03086 family metal-binding protein [Nocardioides pacificus]